MMSKIEKIKNLLIAIPDLQVYHYWHPRLTAPFCIWAEDGEGDSHHSNDRKEEQVITGTIDYFTHNEYDSMVDRIQSAMNDADGVGWQLNSIQREDETNLIHYEWSFQVI